MENPIHISVKAEPIFEIVGFPVTNSLIFSWIAMCVFLLIGVFYAKNVIKKNKHPAFYFLHSFFMYIYNLIESILQDKATYFFPLLASYFFYILINNWMGILPTVGSVLAKPNIVNSIESSAKSRMSENFVTESENLLSEESQNPVAKEEKHVEKVPLFRSNNADINATLALALITVFFVQYYGFKFNGMNYLKKFINFSSPIMFFVGILELISEFSRILSFTFRLFGNILAGEILITIVASLLPSITSFMLVPFFTLEIMAGAIQALVFTMISTVLIGMATQKAHH